MAGIAPGSDEGTVYDFHSTSIVIKSSGDATLGQPGVMGPAYPPELSANPHSHTGEDQMFYLLEGELTGFCDDDHEAAMAGSFVFVPPDRLHGFTVTRPSKPATASRSIGPWKPELADR